MVEATSEVDPRYEETYHRSVERIALWTALIAGAAATVASLLSNLSRESVPIKPDTGSLGYQMLIGSMIVALVATPYAYTKATEYREKSLPEGVRGKYRWNVIPVTIAVTMLIGLLISGSVELLSRAFEGVMLPRVSAVLRTGVFVGVVGYIVVSWVMRMRNSKLIYIGIFYLFATLLIAGATHENTQWYQASFSYLGMTQSNSRYVFNLGLPFTGLLIIIWNIYFMQMFQILVDEGVVTPGAKKTIGRFILTIGILLALVGIVRFGLGLMFNIIHDISATGMGIATGLLMLLAHRYVDRLPRVFYIYSVVAVILIIIAIPLKVLGYYSLTGLELTAFFMCGIWLLVFYRNIEQLVEQIRPDFKI